MKVLLCLLSDQHVPNLLSVHQFKPDQLVLLESPQMQRRGVAQHFLTALELGGQPYQDRHDVQPLDAEDSLESVKRALQAAYGKYPAAEWTANLTGGTKPMSIATYEFFKAVGGQLLYTNVASPARIQDLLTGEVHACDHQPGIREFLAGYGFEGRKTDAVTQAAEDRAGRWKHCAALLARHATPDLNLLVLSDEERNQARKKGCDLRIDQLRLPSDPAVRKSLQVAFWDGKEGECRLGKHEVEFLTGGWLEVFFWNLLSCHQKALGIWDVRLGLEVGRRGETSGNDFDVAFMHEYGLSMVECKSGDQQHDAGGDVVYKVEAVTRQFRALRVRSYLASTGSNLLDKEGRVKVSISTRAGIYNCRILVGEDIRQLADPGIGIGQIKASLWQKSS